MRTRNSLLPCFHFFYRDEQMVKSQILVHPTQASNPALLPGLEDVFCRPFPRLSVIPWWLRTRESFTPVLCLPLGLEEGYQITAVLKYMNNVVSEVENLFYHSLSEPVQNYTAPLSKYSHRSVWQGTVQQTISRHSKVINCALT